MVDTPNLTLPLLAASQAQKHVTVNEALMRLDSMVQIRLLSKNLATPPAVANEGDCYAVPPFSVNDWSGRDGDIAQFSNGGWIFVTPQKGWQAYVVDTGNLNVFDGTEWRAGAVSVTPSGAGMNIRSLEADEVLGAGPTHTTSLLFPERAIVFGVTGRVTDAITGTLTDWRLGDATSNDRFGNGLGLAQNSWVNGPTAPFVVWADTPLVLTGNGGDFASGTIRLTVFYADLTIPDPV